MSATAQDEFNALISSSAGPSDARHPADRSSSPAYEDDDTTIAPSTNRLTSSPTPRSSIRTASTKHRAHYNYDPDASDDNDDFCGDEDTRARRPTTYYLPQNYTPEANTGPKGVIADAQAFEREKRGGRNRSYERTKDLDLPKSQRPSMEVGRPMSRIAQLRKEASEADEAAIQDDDDDAVREWREKRKRELQAQGKGRGRSVGAFEGLQKVDAMGYLEAIESAGRGSEVCVYIFDDGEESSIFARALAKVSARHPEVRMVALGSREAGIDAAGVPALLAYRDGEKFADVMPLGEEVSTSGNVVLELEEVLKSHDIL